MVCSLPALHWQCTLQSSLPLSTSLLKCPDDLYLRNGLNCTHSNEQVCMWGGGGGWSQVLYLLRYWSQSSPNHQSVAIKFAALGIVIILSTPILSWLFNPLHIHLSLPPTPRASALMVSAWLGPHSASGSMQTQVLHMANCMHCTLHCYIVHMMVLPSWLSCAISSLTPTSSPPLPPPFLPSPSLPSHSFPFPPLPSPHSFHVSSFHSSCQICSRHLLWLQHSGELLWKVQHPATLWNLLQSNPLCARVRFTGPSSGVVVSYAHLEHLEQHTQLASCTHMTKAYVAEMSCSQLLLIESAVYMFKINLLF